MNPNYLKLAAAVLVGFFLGYIVYGQQSSVVNHEMDDTISAMTSRMEGKSGEELEMIFLEDMIVHHQGAVAMAELLKKGTERPELLQISNDIITAQTSEIELMTGWMYEWYDISH